MTSETQHAVTHRPAAILAQYAAELTYWPMSEWPALQADYMTRLGVTS